MKLKAVERPGWGGGVGRAPTARHSAAGRV